MSTKNKITFTVKKDDQEIELAVVRPNHDQIIGAQQEYSRTFHKALINGYILREALDRHMVEQGLWDERKQKELDILEDIVKEGVDKLKRGGIKKTEARNIAISVKLAKITQNELLATRNSMYDNTAEGTAENAKFNYLVSVCTVYNDTGKPYFDSLEDYLTRSDDDAAYRAAEMFSNLYYGLDPDFEKKLPENKFLLEFGFMDANGNLTDNKGRRIDLFGRLIDDEGNRIDEAGNRVEEEVVEFQPFLDDEPSEPVEKESEPEPVVVTEKKRGRKKQVS